MERNIDKDWTEELRDMVEDFEVSPSEGAWERLEADMRPRRTVWWPFAATAAAACLLAWIFLFKGTGGEEPVTAVAPSALSMVEEISESPSEEPSGNFGMQEKIEEEPASSAEEQAAVEEEQAASAEEPAVITEEPEAVAEEPAALEESPADVQMPFRPSLQDPDDIFPEPQPVHTVSKARRKVSVTVSAGWSFGGAGNGIYIAQAAPMTKAAGQVMDITEVIRHSTPFRKAIGLSIPIADILDIGTGLDHLSLISEVGPGSQHLEWLGIPLRLGCRLVSRGPASINVGAGVSGEKCISASLLGMNYKEPFQWAANVGADCRVRLFGPLSFSFTPELSYYFTDTVLPTYRSGHPLTFSLRAGLSLNL